MSVLPRALLVSAALVLSLIAARAHGASCTDADAVAAVRAEAAVRCPCNAATSHGQYVSCVARIAHSAVGAFVLPRECASAVKRCASRSTCGRAGAVTCCRTGRSGKTRCSIKRSGASCRSPRAGSACVGTVPSCCDACTASGCTPTTTTSSSTSTTSTTATTLPGVCGDGQVNQPSEQCDGTAGSASCSPAGCGPPGSPHECQCCVPDGGTVIVFVGCAPGICCNDDCYEVGPSAITCSPTCLGPGAPCSPSVPCCFGPCFPGTPPTCG